MLHIANILSVPIEHVHLYTLSFVNDQAVVAQSFMLRKLKEEYSKVLYFLFSYEFEDIENLNINANLSKHLKEAVNFNT